MLTGPPPKFHGTRDILVSTGDWLVTRTHLIQRAQSTGHFGPILDIVPPWVDHMPTWWNRGLVTGRTANADSGASAVGFAATQFLT